jgi:hypothetical protein
MIIYYGHPGRHFRKIILNHSANASVNKPKIADSVEVVYSSLFVVDSKKILDTGFPAEATRPKMCRDRQLS